VASRVTPSEVKAIIETDLTDPVVQVWIDSANSIVNEKAACIGNVETLLTQVELYLSSHFLALLDPDLGGIITKDKAEQLETSFATASIDKNIDATVYGQTAKTLLFLFNISSCRGT